MNFGKKIIDARKKANLSQEEIAEKLNITRQTVSKWESNETVPNINQVKLLAKIYKISLEELLNYNKIDEEIESIIKKTNTKTQDKINWTKVWSKKYPVLETYQNKVNIKKYENDLNNILTELQTKYNYNRLDAMLVLKDILAHSWNKNNGEKNVLVAKKPDITPMFDNGESVAPYLNLIRAMFERLQNDLTVELIIDVAPQRRSKGAKYMQHARAKAYKFFFDETSGLHEKIITESKDRAKVPEAQIADKNGNVLKTYSLPVGAHLMIEEGDELKAGDVFIKTPRASGNAGDITGGLPRVTELFEARNPSNPAIVSEIDGEVTFGKVKRGNREIVVTSKIGEIKKYLVPLSKQILVQENDYVRAGTPLSDGAVTPSDILAIKGPTAVQEYIVNEVQDVYRMQGVKINDKHFEVIVRQMMRKVLILDPGDTRFLEQQVVDKREFQEENDRIWGKKVVTDAGDSQNLKVGQIVTARKLRDENSALKRKDMKVVEVRDAVPATSDQMLQGITRAALQTSSFMSAASFQETTKVLNEAAINGKTDTLEGMKENVICGHLIPAGTGLREYGSLIVGSKEDFEMMDKTLDERMEAEAAADAAAIKSAEEKAKLS